jgi:hypothetical protein
LSIDGLRPEQRQVVTLYGTLIPPGSAAPQPATNDQPFGAVPWRCYLPELHLELRSQTPETELAALSLLTDSEKARLLLEQNIRAAAAAYHDLQIQRCTPQIMRYKPGSRCTILYQLTYPEELAASRNWPAAVVAKTYRGDKGRNAYEAMQALWHSSLGASSTVAVAEPLAYLPALNVLVQGPIREEQTLKDFIRFALRTNKAEMYDTLHAYVRKTAAGLAEMHQCGVRYGEIVSWEDELADVREQHAELVGVLPQLADLGTALLTRLEMLAAVHPADPPAPAHRSFRPAQVLLHQGEIGFIDFDGFCQAEPAMDLALFMSTVKNISLNGVDPDEDKKRGGIDPEVRLARMIQAEKICDIFMDEYAQHAPDYRPRVLLWETLDLLSLVLGSWTKLKLGRLDNCLFMLERHLQVNAI